MKDIAASLLNFSVSFLPYMGMLLLALLIATVATYVMYRTGPDGTSRSLFRFLLGGVLVAFAAGFVGAGLGIAFFCSQSLGNLCGLGGVFLTGPLALIAATVVYLVRWAQQRSIRAT
jgi:hypothetical protein